MRLLWVKLHLWMASFLATILLMIAVSGGLYLFGEKGTTNKTKIGIPNNVTIDLNHPLLETSVRSLFQEVGIEHNFEYIKRSGAVLVTRPTSRTYYEIQLGTDALSVTRHDPDWIKVIVELHKGHGPQMYKRFQQFTAAGLVFVLLSGLWLGVTSKGLRVQTLGAVGLGLLIFAVLAFL
jgi:hypothetical protein